jgi:hypothetical protein
MLFKFEYRWIWLLDEFLSVRSLVMICFAGQGEGETDKAMIRLPVAHADRILFVRYWYHQLIGELATIKRQLSEDEYVRALAPA